MRSVIFVERWFVEAGSANIKKVEAAYLDDCVLIYDRNVYVQFTREACKSLFISEEEAIKADGRVRGWAYTCTGDVVPCYLRRTEFGPSTVYLLNGEHAPRAIGFKTQTAAYKYKLTLLKAGMEELQKQLSEIEEKCKHTEELMLASARLHDDE